MTRTRIEWATDVWNPVTGCTKVSEGCRNCYAERVVKRFGERVHGLDQVPSYPDFIGPGDAETRAFTDVACHPDRLDQPLHWRKPRRVFVCSMGDLFHGDVPDEFLHLVFDAMARATAHDFLVLTKRPDRMRDFVVAANRPLGGGAGWSFGGPFPLPNVWLGVSVEDQKTADERIPLLLQTPAAVRFVSYEPALGPVDLRRIKIPRQEFPAGSIRPIQQTVEIDALACRRITDMGIEYAGSPGLDWVICGGESGPGARPAHPDWFRSMRDQCAVTGVPFFFKQWGEWAPHPAAYGPAGVLDYEGAQWGMARLGKKRAGRELDGRTHDEIPGVSY